LTALSVSIGVITGRAHAVGMPKVDRRIEMQVFFALKRSIISSDTLASEASAFLRFGAPPEVTL
jgi:hypothetical protein